MKGKVSVSGSQGVGSLAEALERKWPTPSREGGVEERPCFLSPGRPPEPLEMPEGHLTLHPIPYSPGKLLILITSSSD